MEFVTNLYSAMNVVNMLAQVTIAVSLVSIAMSLRNNKKDK